jgi:hypothetical protein
MSDQDHNENLLDLAAMFAMNGLIEKHSLTQLMQPQFQESLGTTAYALAEALLAAKHPKSGITSVKRRKRNDTE